MADVPLAKTPLPVSEIDATGTASATTYLRGDGSWSTPEAGTSEGGELSTPIAVNVFMGASANTNWSTIAADTAGIGNGYRLSTGAQNATVSFEVYLGVGTWEIDLMYAKGGNMGIITVAVGGATEGTVDAYAASGTRNHIATITPVDVVTAGIKTITLTMATKNASSSNYYGQIQHIQVRRPLA